MVSYQDIVNKLKQRVESGVAENNYVEGVNAYVNDPEFPQKFEEQKQKAIEGYKNAGAPETWATKQALKLQLVSADEWKSAITAEGVADRYKQGLLNALTNKAKLFSIPAEQDNTIQEIIDKLKITDTKKRMLVAYDVGQHFEKAVLYRLAGDSSKLNSEITALINDLHTDGIIPDDGKGNPDQTAINTVKQIVMDRIEACFSQLTS